MHLFLSQTVVLLDTYLRVCKFLQCQNDKIVLVACFCDIDNSKLSTNGWDIKECYNWERNKDILLHNKRQYLIERCKPAIKEKYYVYVSQNVVLMKICFIQMAKPWITIRSRHMLIKGYNVNNYHLATQKHVVTYQNVTSCQFILYFRSNVRSRTWHNKFFFNKLHSSCCSCMNTDSWRGILLILR